MDKKAQLTIRQIIVIFALIGAIGLFLRALSGDINGAIIGWANSQIPFWVTLPSGILVIGFIVYSLFRKNIDDFINNFDLSGGRL